MKPETRFQIDVVTWLKERGFWAHHSPNEANVTAAQRRLMARMGMVIGWPDLEIREGCLGFGEVAFIELKDAEGEASPDQTRVLAGLSLHHSKVGVCSTLEEVQAVLGWTAEHEQQYLVSLRYVLRKRLLSTEPIIELLPQGSTHRRGNP